MTSPFITRRDARAYWPLLAALVVFAMAVGAPLLQSLARNDGNFIYALDDPYIHMAMAKNLVRSGVWGVTPEGFTSSSSSLLWTLILAAVYAVVGVSEMVPLVLNMLFALLLLGGIFLIARDYEAPPWGIFTIMVGTIVLTPLPTLILEGLEHVLQILLDLCFVFYAVRTLRDDAPNSTRAGRILILLSPLVAAVRYEGCFLVLIVCLMLFAKRRLRLGCAVAAVGALPIVIFGVVSLSLGWSFLPNSVLLKAQWTGGLPQVSSFKQLLSASMRAEKVLLDTPHLFVLMIAALALLLMELRDARLWSAATLWNAAFVILCLLHLQFAATGWFYRYESYLVALGLIALAITAPHVARFRQLLTPPAGPPRLAGALAALVLAALMAFPLISRAASALVDTPIATSNIYQQQYQMGQFVRTSYPRARVAANDIGAITFLSDGPILDLAGLASSAVGAAVRSGRYNGAVMQQLAQEQHVEIAIMYDQWFVEGGIPGDWRKVGQWTIPERVAAARATVSFYAVARDAEADLIANLRAFSERLPKAVSQKGAYVD